MKKRIISLILALLMILTLLPAAAFAEDETQSIDPTSVEEQAVVPQEPETPAEPEQPVEPEPPAQPEETTEPEETPQKPETPDDLEVSEADEGLSVQYFNPQIEELREENGFKLVGTYSQLSQCLLYGYNARLTNNVDSDTEETNRYKMLTVRPLNDSTEITLDLNGYSITYKGVEAQECLFDLRNNDTPFTFRVIDSQGGGKVYCTNSSGAFADNNTIFYIQLGNKLRIEGGEFVQQTNSNSSTIIQVAEPNGSAAAAATSSADITITGGKFQNNSNAKLIYTCENQTGRIVNVALCGGEFIYCAKTRYNTNTTYPIAPMLLKNTKLFTAGATMTAVDPASDRLHCYLDVYNDACKTLTLCGTHPALFNYRDTSYVPAAVGSKLAKTTAIGSSINSYVEYVHPLITCPTLNITDIDRKEGWAKVFFEGNIENSDAGISRAALKCPGRANRGDTITLELGGLPDGTDPSNVTWECYIGSDHKQLGSSLTAECALDKTGTYIFWAYVNKGQSDEMKDQFRVTVTEKPIDTVGIQLNRPVDTGDIEKNTFPSCSFAAGGGGIFELTGSAQWTSSGSSTYRKELVLVAKDGLSFAENTTVTCDQDVTVVGTPAASKNGGYSYLTFTIEVTPKEVLTEIVGIVTGLTNRRPLSQFKITSEEADIKLTSVYTVDESGKLHLATGTTIDDSATYCIFASVTPADGYVIRGKCTVVLKEKKEALRPGQLDRLVKIAELTRYDRTTDQALQLGGDLVGQYYGLISLDTNNLPQRGDLNWDGSVNASDMQALYEYLTQGTPPAAGLAACDLSGDKVIDVYDLQYLYELVNTMQ